MVDIQKAAADLSEIKLRISQSQKLNIFEPIPLAFVGCLALVGGFIQSQSPNQLDLPSRFFGFWIVLAVLSVGCLAAVAYFRSRRLGLRFHQEQLTAAADVFLPSGLVGIAVGWVMFKHLPEALWILPGLWSTLLSMALFTARPRLPSGGALVAIWYFLAGVITMLLSANSTGLSPWSMAVPFGGGQFLMAIVVAKERKSHV